MSAPNELINALEKANNSGALNKDQQRAYEELKRRNLNDRPRVPLFEAAKNNPFLMGYMDQAAGISQIAARMAPDSRSPEIILDEEMSKDIPASAERIDKFIKEQEKGYQRTRKDDGIDWARLAGNVFNPISLGTLPAGTAVTVPGKIAAGGGYGAFSGATMPVTQEGADFGASKATQAGVGIAIGLAVPSAVETIKGGINLLSFLKRPFNEAGKLKDLQEMYSRLAGDAKDELIEALDNAKTYTFGNKPTSAQAIAEYSAKHNMTKGAAIARLEKDLSRKPTTGDPLKTVFENQSLRRQEAMSRLIDSSDMGLATAEQLRKTATAPLYDQVRASTKKVKTGETIKLIKNLINENPKQTNITRPLKNILKDMYIQGPDFVTLERSPRALYSLSKEIKRLMNTKTPGGQKEFDVMALSQVKKSLDKSIENAEPAYKAAQKEFKKMSEPINQIKVIRHLGGALEDALQKERARPFLNALRDAPKTLKKSTGFPRYKKLNDILNKNQIKVLDDIKAELIRQEKTAQMASGTESVYGILKEGIEPELPNMLSRPALIANAILRKIGKDMGPEYEKIAVQIQEHPEYLASLLRKSTKDSERKMAYELLQVMAATAPIKELSRYAQPKDDIGGAFNTMAE